MLQLPPSGAGNRFEIRAHVTVLRITLFRVHFQRVVQGTFVKQLLLVSIKYRISNEPFLRWREKC